MTPISVRGLPLENVSSAPWYQTAGSHLQLSTMMASPVCELITNPRYLSNQNLES